MKALLFTIIIILGSVNVCFGHSPKVPKNLKQAVVYLNQDCPDSLKDKIKKTDAPNLKELCYPWGGKYKTIFDWTSNENENSKIVKYLESKGVKWHHQEVLLVAFRFFLLGQKIDEKDIYRPYQLIEKKAEDEDKVKYTADSLSGIYIPKDLDDCIKQINSFWPDSTKAKLRLLTEREFTGRLHHGFGMWMRNNWHLWAGSRLSKYFIPKLVSFTK